MSTKKCFYCGNFVYDFTVDTLVNAITCDNCKKVVEKLDSETLSWLITVIDIKIERAVDEHRNRYDHEYDEPQYY